MSTSPGRVPTLLLAAALLVVEALAALVFGALEASQIRPVRAVMGVGVTLIMLGYGVLLLVVARGVARGRRWSRGLAVVTQLILLLLGYSFRQPPTTWAGLLMGLVALVVLVCLLAPRSTRAFLGEDAADRRRVPDAARRGRRRPWSAPGGVRPPARPRRGSGPARRRAGPRPRRRP